MLSKVQCTLKYLSHLGDLTMVMVGLACLSVRLSLETRLSDIPLLVAVEKTQTNVEQQPSVWREDVNSQERWGLLGKFDQLLCLCASKTVSFSTSLTVRPRFHGTLPCSLHRNKKAYIFLWLFVYCSCQQWNKTCYKSQLPLVLFQFTYLFFYF